MFEAIGLDEFVFRVRDEIKKAKGLLTEAAAAYLVWINWINSKEVTQK